MAHVVVDQAEGEASVHESQAPLGGNRERNPDSAHRKLINLMTYDHFLTVNVQMVHSFTF